MAEAEALKWDRAEFQRRWLVKSGAEIDAKRAAAEQAEQEPTKARQEERRQVQRDRLLATARAAFLANGGTESDWEAQKDSIEAEIRHAAGVQAATSGETDQQRRMRRDFARAF